MISIIMRRVMNHSLSIAFAGVAMAALFIVLIKMFTGASMSEMFSRVITLQVSAIAFAGLVVIGLLLVINFLHNMYRHNKMILEQIAKEKEIDTTKTEFISLVSHQLRTPLSAVNWYTEALTTGDLGPLTIKQKEYLRRIDASNRRMVSLIDSILNASQIELDTFVIHPEATDICILVDSVLEELKSQIDLREIRIVKNYDNCSSVMIDPRYVRMVLDNLISNAVKYTPKQGIVTITIGFKDKNLAITVADTGYGIPKSEFPKVFEKLYRGHNILDKDTDGNGLGLYIVKSIIKYSGGKIWFESTEGKGTTFFVTIPITDQETK